MNSFSNKVILLNQVSGFIGQYSNLKHDIIDSHYGGFNYSKECAEILLPVIDVTRINYVPI